MAKITIDFDKCKGAECAECVDVCPQECLILEGDDVKVVDVEDCNACEVCMDVCPEAYIEIEED